MENELNFFLNELVNYFPNRIDFPSKDKLFAHLAKKEIISVSNYLDFDDFVSYENSRDICRNVNSDCSKTKLYCIYAYSFFNNPKCIDDLIGMINDPDDSIRAIAIYTLGQLKINKAVPVLLQEIENNVPMIKNEIIVALGKIGDIAAYEKLRELMLEEEFNIQSIIALGRLGTIDGLKILVKYIKTGTENQKCAAIYASNNFKSKKLNEILLRQLENSSGFVANIIVYILGEKKVESAVKDIIAKYILEHISKDVAFSAILSISKNNIDIAISLLKDNDPPARLIGAKVLGKINNKSAVPDIIEAFENEYIFTLGGMILDSEESGSDIFAMDDIFVLEEYLNTLTQLGGSDAIICIDKSCSHENNAVSMYAMECIKRVIKKENIKVLMKNIENVTDATKSLILEKLITLKNDNYIENIFEFLHDTNTDLSFLSAMYLGSHKDKRAMGKLSEIVGIKHELAEQAQTYISAMGF